MTTKNNPTGNRTKVSKPANGEIQFTEPQLVASRKKEQLDRLKRNKTASESNREKKHKVASASHNRPVVRRNSNLNNNALILISVIVLVLAGVLWGCLHKNAQAVFVDDLQIGIIRDVNLTTEEFTKAALAKLKTETKVNVEINEAITLKPIHASKKEIATTDYVLSEVCKHFTYKQEAAVITVDGVEMAVLENSEAAQGLLDEILNSFEVIGENIISKDFAEEVKVQAKFVSADEIISKEEANSILTSSSTTEKKYTVVAGDTLSKIAADADMSLDELYRVNPTLQSGDYLKLGQELNLVVPTPLLSVKTVEQITYTESIEPPTETIENNNEYKTYRKVITAGKEGEKEVTANIIRINGYEEETKVMNEKVITEAVPQQVEIGTLQTPPKRATGSFIYPVNGQLSSTFGARGGAHKGIDICAPAGTSIFASDGGTVTLSEMTSNGYGNLVVIDHGNGFKTYYAHNSENLVSVGDKVAQGDLIAKVGTTGNSTGNHCHFELHLNDMAYNPFDYLG